mmetsp:Transcript_20289/g.33643  ORF Transcript_20289/g.33643 Transcript_20289/m.33643 type:complete len:238 (+) Transcript_20289:214-927(+)|eukprot:CAMPEP_0119301914 /NCGR_PEP_ID=MMETSP1333-20130426/3619_1 /TAXON_ID=418940 /ORGANISM="Scyphosphaera apsteinii, Strain RCC1455" /LENGTH=237 /DNA_ID=CAMNT_0007304125 /DNA_START=214 /DNA_END=930 /DNA_ORIENTATION=+
MPLNSSASQQHSSFVPKANPADPQALKKEGNEHFRKGHFEAAATCYTRAIDLWMEPKDRAVLYVNRAATKLKQALYESALRDSDRAIELDDAYPKAHFRRGQALSALRRHADAATSMTKVLALSPGDTAAQEALQQEAAAASVETAQQPQAVVAVVAAASGMVESGADATDVVAVAQEKAAQAAGTPPEATTAERVASLLARLQRKLVHGEHDPDTLNACMVLLEACEARLEATSAS